MGMTARAAGFIAVAAAPIALLAGCGGSTGAGASATLQRIQPTSFVTQLPATTTTTTTLPPDQQPVDTGPQFSPDEQLYTIVAGDSMFAIASKHGIEAEVLAQYNQWPDGINHLLIPGEQIRIPPNSQIPAAVTTVPAGIDPDAGQPQATSCIYTIVAGDNPSKIADRFDISVLDLQGANSASVMNSFLVGAQLVIPGVADCGE